MGLHLFFGTINGHQFVVATFGTIRLEQHYSAKRWVTNRVHSQAKDLAKNIQWTPLGLENAPVEIHGKTVKVDVTIIRQEVPVVILEVQNVTKHKA